MCFLQTTIRQVSSYYQFMSRGNQGRCKLINSGMREAKPSLAPLGQASLPPWHRIPPYPMLDCHRPAYCTVQHYASLNGRNRCTSTIARDFVHIKLGRSTVYARQKQFHVYSSHHQIGTRPASAHTWKTYSPVDTAHVCFSSQNLDSQDSTAAPAVDLLVFSKRRNTLTLAHRDRPSLQIHPLPIINTFGCASQWRSAGDKLPCTGPSAPRPPPVHPIPGTTHTVPQ